MGNITAHVNVGGGFLSAPIIASAVPSVVPRDLEGIIVRAVGSARAAGRDYMSQSRAAATAVLAVRPDFSMGQALDAVTQMRELAHT